MIPKRLKEKHFLQAAAQIDRDGVPKYVISLAAFFANGREYPFAEFNAVEARDYFLSRGYDVIDRRAEAEKAIVSEDDESSFPEGTESYRLHRHLERDCKITRKAKAKRLADTGKLECEVCGFDFVMKYGDLLGLGFIEAHHTTPVSKLGGMQKTKIADLALVCSNCHRMLHRGRVAVSVDQLAKIVADRAIT